MARSYRSYRRSKRRSFGFFKFFMYAIGAIALLVIGINLAFWLNNWKQERENLKLFHLNLTSLVEDLETDMTGIARILQFDSLQFDSIITLSDLLRLGPRERSPERLVLLFHICIHRQRFSVKETTFAGMMSAGGMYLAEYTELKKDIIEYYETAENLLSDITSNQNIFYQTFNSFMHSAGDISGLYFSILQSGHTLPDLFDEGDFQVTDPVYLNRVGIANWRSTSLPITTMINLLGWRANLIEGEIEALQEILQRGSYLKSRIDTFLSEINLNQ